MAEIDGTRTHGSASLALLAVLVGAACVGCARGKAPAPPDVVLVVLDAAAARHFGLYGYDRPTTPRIDALAKDALVWERAYAQAPQTTDSMASLLTGRYPVDAWAERELLGTSLPEHLRAAGYRTLAFVENPWLSAALGFDRGFDHFERQVDARSPTSDAALAALDASNSKPVFLYVHLLPPHSPYAPPQPYRGRFADTPDEADHRDFVASLLGEVGPGEAREDAASVLSGESPLTPAEIELLRARYDEALAWADARVGRLIDGLRARDRLDRTLLIITADHGEAFGQHGHYTHASSLYEPQIRVPLLMRLPTSMRNTVARSAGRIAEPVQLTSLPDTILDLLGMPPPGDDLHIGRDLFAGAPPSGRIVRSFRGGRGQAIIQGRYKLLLRDDAPLQLFDVVADPAERRNLASERPDVVRRLARAAWTAHAEGEKPRLEDVGDETRVRLEQLGYLQ